MKSISFKNFRRFADFPEFKFGDITILVGGNNAGKSTLVKAVEFLTDNLKVLNDHSRIDSSIVLPDFDVRAMGSYGRIHCNDTEGRMEFSISFDKFVEYGTYFHREDPMNCERFIINVELECAQPNAKLIQISKIVITDVELGFRITCSQSDDNQHSDVKVEWMSFNIPTDDLKLKIDPSGFDEFMCKHKSVVDECLKASMMGEDLGFEEYQVESYVACNLRRASYTYEKWVNTDEPRFDSSIEYRSSNLDFDDDIFRNIGDIMKHVAKHLQIRKCAVSWRIKEAIKRINTAINGLGINKTTISSERIDVYRPGDKIYSLIDKFFHNRLYYLTARHNEFFGKSISPKKTLSDSLREMLADFEIGKDFEIEPIVGYDAYTIRILSLNGQWVNLSELGSGSIRLFQLFLNILISDTHSYLYIEEPEQNLHPKMQSRLADLFYKCSKVLARKLIIETHSEYLIRRTQVLTAEMNCENEDELEKQNPFKVYYFPGNSVPYDMKYLPNGHFEESFGEGFFDEAGRWTRELMRNKRR